MALDALTILVPRAAQTASFNSTPINVPDAGFPDDGFLYEMIVSAVTGTTPTLAGAIQVSRDNGTTYLPAGTFRNSASATSDTITAAGRYYAHVRLPVLTAGAGATYPLKLRFSGTIGGTTPSLTIQVGQVLSWNG